MERPERVEIEPAVDFLTLRTDRRSLIDLHVPGPMFTFLPTEGPRLFVDYAWIPERLFRLFHGLDLPDQNFKGEILEQVVRQGISELPIKACKARDGSSKQIDAAFDLGDVLLIVECKV